MAKMRRLLWLMGWIKIPMIAFVRPKLLTINENELQLKIKLRRRTKNHLKSMYFGALAVGADIAAGLHAYYFAEMSGKKISFAFKSMNVQFLKRATSDVTFYCQQGELIASAMSSAISSQERINQMVNVYACNEEGEEIATFEMEISVKVLN